MRSSGRALLIALMGLMSAGPALADQEASNVAHVAAGPYGRCYAKSVPAHIYDPDGEPRQQGVTRVYRVGEGEDDRRSFLTLAMALFSRREYVLEQ